MIYKRVLKLIIVVAIVFTATIAFCASGPAAPKFVPTFPMIVEENVVIIWMPVPGAEKYKLYADGKLISDDATSPYELQKPKEEGEYKYVVSAVDKAGLEGAKSAEGVLNLIFLRPPREIKYGFLHDISQRDEKYPLRLIWEKVPGALEYVLYKAVSEDGPYKIIDSVKKNIFVDREVDQTKDVGKAFYYQIISIDKMQKTSDASGKIKVFVPPIIKIGH